jgi:GntR family transcriptional regulator
MRAEPLHAQLYDSLRREIAEQRQPVGSTLPSEAEIAAEHGMSRITVRHALQRLEQDGFIRKRRGSKTVVVANEPAAARAGWRIDSIEDIIAVAGKARLDIKSYRREARREAAELFGLPPDARLACLRSVLARDGAPYARSTIYFRPDAGERLKRRHFDDVIVFRVVQRELGVTFTDVRQTIRVVRAEAEDEVLGLAPGEPVVETILVYRAGEEAPIEIAFTRYPAESFNLTYSLMTSRRP